MHFKQAFLSSYREVYLLTNHISKNTIFLSKH